MRRTKRSGNSIFCLLLNVLLNIEGLIPAAILLALHFWLGISVWWAVAALGLWLLWIILWMLLMGAASKCSNEVPVHKENKNPYSSKNADLPYGTDK